TRRDPRACARGQRRRSLVSDRMRRGERLPDRRRQGRALGVAEPTDAHALRIKVVNDVIVLTAVRHAGRHVIEPEVVAHLPRDVVIRAGGITAHAEAADELPMVIVQRQAAPEHVGPPDWLPGDRTGFRRAAWRRTDWPSRERGAAG